MIKNVKGGGKAGFRGYYLQALVTVLDSLDEKFPWDYIIIEPEEEYNKIDLKWGLGEESLNRYVQIKSSINPITKNIVNTWTREMKDGNPALENLTLIAFGPAGHGIQNEMSCNDVAVTIKNLDLDSLNDQGILKLIVYLGKRNISISPEQSKQLFVLLKERFEKISIKGNKYQRIEFNQELKSFFDAEKVLLDTVRFDALPDLQELFDKIIMMIEKTFTKKGTIRLDGSHFTNYAHVMRFIDMRQVPNYNEFYFLTDRYIFQPQPYDPKDPVTIHIPPFRENKAKYSDNPFLRQSTRLAFYNELKNYAKKRNMTLIIRQELLQGDFDSGLDENGLNNLAENRDSQLYPGIEDLLGEWEGFVTPIRSEDIRLL